LVTLAEAAPRAKRAGEGGDFLWRTKGGGIGSGSDTEGNDGLGATADDTPMVMLEAAFRV
jgi:hypothetical protein